MPEPELMLPDRVLHENSIEEERELDTLESARTVEAEVPRVLETDNSTFFVN